MIALLLFRIICRKTWIAATLLCLIFGAFTGLQLSALLGPEFAVFFMIVNVATIAMMFFILLRFGLLAVVAYSIFNGLANISPFTYDTSAPYFGTGLLVTLVAFALAAYCWKISLAGRTLLQDSILDS